MKSFISLFTVALLALGLAACSTPDARIQRNPEIFARLTPAQQEMIRHGQVGLGFTPEMVRLALGDADRVIQRQDETGTSEIWSYVTYDGPGGMPLYRGWYHRYYDWNDVRYPYYLNYPARRDREHFRVVFQDGKVTSIEQQTR
ncbi:hypothetical protein K0B96_10640 [Horticoccus luteus]|uniref:Lipoprotein SmpA/OmlA domain-containing protein n=1 Tax=Horticoccus luteus TaxID=2862869 RepID=A0A8F9TU17_9BACT|nr:hypothetical protein [Horticoccus luteus]QYM77779.1 hypothetical protein K0B96_10640 [Horticoccus luteus]